MLPSFDDGKEDGAAMRSLFERLKRLRQRRDIASDLAEEIETHRLMTERRLRESGLTFGRSRSSFRHRTTVPGPRRSRGA